MEMVSRTALAIFTFYLKHKDKLLQQAAAGQTTEAKKRFFYPSSPRRLSRRRQRCFFRSSTLDQIHSFQRFQFPIRNTHKSHTQMQTVVHT